MDKRYQLSILDQWASQSGQVSRSTERLAEIAEWIDWEPLYQIGPRVDKTGTQGGQPRKPVRWMIRGLFLKHLYQLSDPQLEDQLIDRLSFRRFAGLPLDQQVPDFTSFWRLQEALAEQGLIKELFGQINAQLEAKGLLLKQGTVVDASIMESTNRPLSDKKRQQLEGDPSAHDSTVLEELVSEDERSLFGDKAYSRDALKSIARQKGWYYGILDKSKRRDPLSGAQKQRNRRHQRVRSQVEHAFAAIKDRNGMRLTKAKNRIRNETQFLMKAVCWNIERSITWAKKRPKITPASAP